MIAQDLETVVIAGYHPGVQTLVPVHRGEFPQPPEYRVRTFEEISASGIEVRHDHKRELQ
jgi:hypothetical protein